MTDKACQLTFFNSYSRICSSTCKRLRIVVDREDCRVPASTPVSVVSWTDTCLRRTFLCSSAGFCSFCFAGWRDFGFGNWKVLCTVRRAYEPINTSFQLENAYVSLQTCRSSNAICLSSWRPSSSCSRSSSEDSISKSESKVSTTSSSAKITTS